MLVCLALVLAVPDLSDVLSARIRISDHDIARGGRSDRAAAVIAWSCFIFFVPY